MSQLHGESRVWKLCLVNDTNVCFLKEELLLTHLAFNGNKAFAKEREY